MTRAELLAAHPAPKPTELRDLPEWENVWTEHVELRAVAHRSADRLTSLCGRPVLEWPVAAGHLLVLSGTLCRDGCWIYETPGGLEPPGDERTR